MVIEAKDTPEIETQVPRGKLSNLPELNRRLVQLMEKFDKEAVQWVDLLEIPQALGVPKGDHKTSFYIRNFSYRNNCRMFKNHVGRYNTEELLLIYSNLVFDLNGAGRKNLPHVSDTFIIGEHLRKLISPPSAPYDESLNLNAHGLRLRRAKCLGLDSVDLFPLNGRIARHFIRPPSAIPS